MGWYDYFVNEPNDSAFTYRILTASPHEIWYVIPANTNVLCSRGGWCSVWMYLVDGDDETLVWTAPSNMCQNFEFQLDPSGGIEYWDQYIHPPPGPLQNAFPPTAAAGTDYMLNAPAASMDHSGQRLKGLELVGEDASPLLRSMIEHSSSFSSILVTAANELGIDRVANSVASDGDVEWAYQALLSLRLDEDHKRRLIDKIAGDPKWSFYTARDVNHLDPDSRQALLHGAAADAAWASFAVRDIADLGDAREALLSAANG